MQQLEQGREFPIYEIKAIQNHSLEGKILYTFKKPNQKKVKLSMTTENNEEYKKHDFIVEECDIDSDEEIDSDQPMIKSDENNIACEEEDDVREFTYCPYYDGLILISTPVNNNIFNNNGYFPKLKLFDCKSLEISSISHLNEILGSDVFGERNNRYNRLVVRVMGDGTIVMALNNICIGVDRLSGSILWKLDAECPIRNVSNNDLEHVIILTIQKLLKFNIREKKIIHEYDFMLDNNDILEVELLCNANMEIVDQYLYLRYSSYLKVFNIENLEEVLNLNVGIYCNGSPIMYYIIDSFLILDGFVMNTKNQLLIRQENSFLLDGEEYSWINYSYQYKEKLFVMQDRNLAFYNTSNWSITKIDRNCTLNQHEMDQIDRLGGFTPFIYSSSSESGTDWQLLFRTWSKVRYFKMDQYVFQANYSERYNGETGQIEKYLIGTSVSQEQFLHVYLTNSNTIVLQTDRKKEEGLDSMTIVEYLSKLTRVDVIEFNDSSYEYFTMSLDFPFMVKMVSSISEKRLHTLTYKILFLCRYVISY